MELEPNALDNESALESDLVSGLESTPKTSNEVVAETPIRFVTQSKYFSPAFNAAIFDGPIRIYFAQYQEAQALKLYHNLQERFGEVRKQARGIFKERGRNIFVMLYPTDEVFEMAFGEDNESGTEGLGSGAEAGRGVGTKILAQPVTSPQILQDRLGDDYVLGVCGPMEDEGLDIVCERMESIVHSA